MAKHMTLDTRKGIAHGLSCGLTFAEMAGMFHRAESTIANEVKNRMIWSNKGYGCTNAVCEHFDACSKIYRTPAGKKTPFKSQRRCFEMCEDFRQRTCADLGHAPYVCNGCDRQTRCPLRKRYYVADAAQENYRGILSDARRGTQADESVIADMNAALKDPIKTGRQSIRAVMAAKPTSFHGFSERSVYNYANSQLFDVKRGDMPLMCRRKPPKPGKTVAKADAKCRVGRSYQDYLSFLGVNFGVQPVEVDTVVGTPDGKVLSTMMFSCDPYRSTQKPHVENNHLLIRRVMPKGSSFDGLRQEQVDRMISHVNSYPRQSLGGRTPYDEFVSFYGERGRVFLEKLNVRRINADCVTLAPSLLGPEFKREADNAILRKNGVTK